METSDLYNVNTSTLFPPLAELESLSAGVAPRPLRLDTYYSGGSEPTRTADLYNVNVAL